MICLSAVVSDSIELFKRVCCCGKIEGLFIPPFNATKQILHSYYFEAVLCFLAQCGGFNSSSILFSPKDDQVQTVRL